MASTRHSPIIAKDVRHARSTRRDVTERIGESATCSTAGSQASERSSAYHQAPYPQASSVDPPTYRSAALTVGAARLAVHLISLDHRLETAEMSSNCVFSRREYLIYHS